MSKADIVTDFVRDALRAGQSRAAIAEALKAAGWADRQVARALDLYAEVPFAVPVPRPRSALSGRDLLFYGLMSVALAVSTVQVVELLHALIDLAFPPQGRTLPGDWRRGAVNRAVAALIVFGPVFLLLRRRDRSLVAADPSRRRSDIRQLTTALALFATSVILLSTLAFVVYSLLQGQARPAFLLKALSVAAVAGAVFVAYRRPGDLDDA